MMGTLVGIGVGPGPGGLVSVAGWRAIEAADRVVLPRSTRSTDSVALQALGGLTIPEEKRWSLAFLMTSDRSALTNHYARIGETVAERLKAGEHIAYLTIGDPMTYSTWIYTRDAVCDVLPEATVTTIPGVTSYAAAAAALGWPLGEGRERVLVLPCPDDLDALKADILSSDVVVLMKIGHRLSGVLKLLDAMGISQHCALARRIGLEGEVLAASVAGIEPPGDQSRLGYLSTMLIRKTPRSQRHRT